MHTSQGNRGNYNYGANAGSMTGYSQGRGPANWAVGGARAYPAVPSSYGAGGMGMGMGVGIGMGGMGMGPGAVTQRMGVSPIGIGYGSSLPVFGLGLSMRGDISPYQQVSTLTPISHLPSFLWFWVLRND